MTERPSDPIGDAQGTNGEPGHEVTAAEILAAQGNALGLSSESDLIEEMIESVRELDDAQAATIVSGQDAPDAAEVLSGLNPDRQSLLVHEMEDDAAAEALVHMDPQLASTVLLDLDDAECASIIGHMDPDDAVDLLQLLPEQRRETILALLHPRVAAILGKLSLYHPETAGGVMTTSIVVVREGLTIGGAIDRVKAQHLDDEQTEVYVVDDQKRLLGTIGLRDLIVVADEEPLADHIDREVRTVEPELDREEVARLFSRYDYRTMPVVDQHRRILGMITVDDVLDIIQAESTEDALKQVGAGREGVGSTIATKMRSRTPWLVFNLLLAAIGAAVILMSQGLIEAIPVLAALFPVIANQAGNMGNQTMALTLRGLVLGEIKSSKVRALVLKELVFGILVGLLVGAIYAVAIGLLGMLGQANGWEMVGALTWPIGIIAGSAMAGALGASCLIGAAVPLALERFKLDPATASSIFVTMGTDLLSYATFLGLVALTKSWLQAGSP